MYNEFKHFFYCANVLVLVKAFSKEGKVNEAIEAVRDMEQKGVVGEASVYCELAFSLCYNGLWQEAILEVLFNFDLVDSRRFNELST